MPTNVSAHPRPRQQRAPLIVPTLGKLQFYLEALDRDLRKPHERPSIGMLICATKDDQVVEYALGRSMSPTLIAEYQTMLPSKVLLRAKLHESVAHPPDGAGGGSRSSRP